MELVQLIVFLVEVAYVLTAVGVVVLVIKKVEKRRDRIVWSCVVVLAFAALPAYYLVPAKLEERRAIARMKAMRAHFEKRCAEDARITIKRVVENVDGVFIMKRRTKENTGSAGDQYAIGDFYGYSADSGMYPGMLIEGSNTNYEGKLRERAIVGYQFVEMPNSENGQDPNAAPFIRITANEKFKKPDYFQVVRTTVDQLTSRYGFDWEDISTPEDRKHWVAGGRTRIVDLSTNEVLAERVGFVVNWSHGGRVGGGVWSPGIGNGYCPDFVNEDYKTLEFLEKVLKSSKRRSND